jgi:hypothetical protein
MRVAVFHRHFRMEWRGAKKSLRHRKLLAFGIASGVSSFILTAGFRINQQ